MYWNEWPQEVLFLAFRLVKDWFANLPAQELSLCKPEMPPRLLLLWVARTTRVEGELKLFSMYFEYLLSSYIVEQFGHERCRTLYH